VKTVPLVWGAPGLLFLLMKPRSAVHSYVCTALSSPVCVRLEESGVDGLKPPKKMDRGAVGRGVELDRVRLSTQMRRGV
jgi:hypothetical protein